MLQGKTRKIGSGRKVAPFLLLLWALSAQAAEPANLVPRTSVAEGNGSIAAAWFAEPTSRYAHGALGDSIEAGALAFRLRDGTELRYRLPENRVFEDHQPRLLSLPSLGDLAMVVESDSRLGARLALYGFTGKSIALQAPIALQAYGPFIGTGHRWLAPVGVGDFDGDGKPDAALIVTPHLTGILRVYRLQAGALPLLAEAAGYSNHIYGQPEIVLSAVLPRPGGDWIITPDREGRGLVALTVENGKLVEKRKHALPARAVRLEQAGADFTVVLEDGRRLPLHF